MTHSPFAAIAALAVLATAGMAGYVATPAEAQRGTVRASDPSVAAQKGTLHQGATSPEQRAAWLRCRATSGWLRNYYPRPGWSVRQGQRAARKHRNQQRNRRAHRC